ncbi:MAG: hypothetical protein JW881_18785, partial [Spirochaetales bacterium]|nr:hypothetical protein [Spirochaetales bacterium]
MRTRTCFNRRFRRYTRTVVLLCIAVMVLSAGCDIDEPAKKKPTIISENTVILDDESLDLITVDPENPLNLAFTDLPAHSVIQELKTGNIIVAGPHRKVPTGFLRKVESVTKSGNEVIVRTSNAKLGDAIEQCRLRETVPVAVTDSPRTGYTTGRGVTYVEIKGGNIDMVKQIEVNGVELTASFSLEPKAVIELDIDRHGLNTFMFKLVFEVKANGDFSTASEKDLEDLLEDLDLIDDLDWLDFDDEIHIPTSISPIIFFINIVPVVITPELALEYGWEVKLYGSCDMSITKSYTFEAGFRYENRKVKPVKKFSQEPVQFEINTSSGVMFRPFVGPKLSFLFYDCGGPYIAFDVFGEIDGNVSAEGFSGPISTEAAACLNLSVSGGMECVVGIDLNDKFEKLIGEEAEEVLEGICFTIFRFTHLFKEIRIPLFSSRPDLVPGKISPDILIPVDGDVVTFSSVIDNARSTASEGFDIYWQYDEEEPVIQKIPGIPGYASIPVEYSKKVSTGSHTLLLTVDPDNAVDEASEYNNTSTPYTLNVEETYPPMADFSVKFQPVDEEEFVNGNTVPVKARITNEGSLPSEPCSIRWTWDRTVLKIDQIKSISPLHYIEVSHDYTMYYGPHTLFIEVDFEDKVKEPPVDNNIDIMPIYVQPPRGVPDLRCSGISYDPSKLWDGNHVRFKTTIGNEGTGQAGGFVIRWTMDGSPVKVEPVSSLAAGAEIPIYCEPEVYQGNYPVCIGIVMNGSD